MANEEHLRILKRGVYEWNEWRTQEPAATVPDLTYADLFRANLGGADLINANLVYANLSGAYLKGALLAGASLVNANLNKASLGGANLSHARLDYATLINADLTEADFGSSSIAFADLTGASGRRVNLGGVKLPRTYLKHADFSEACFSGADLSEADFEGTNLSDANLGGANLTRAILRYANLSSAELSRTRLTEASIVGTHFTNVDLRGVIGLEEVGHYAISFIDASTFHRSEGNIPEAFLRGCGLKDWEIEAVKLYRTGLSRDQIVDITYKVIELRSDPFIQFNSCFISYSSKDEEFARRLYSDLQHNGVRCWFAPEHMKIGDRIRRRIDDSILLHDKLLLVLSETSIASQWIEQEVATGLEKEREQGRDVLFPIRLDDAVLSVRSDWPALLKNTRHIGDFRLWGDANNYRKAFSRLLNDLRV